MICVQLERIITLAWDKELGIKLRTIRQTKSITRKELGQLTNISYALLEKLEMGLVTTVTTDKLFSIANALTVNISELYSIVQIKYKIHS
jgi:transcriptional regulator with XRE-family HTH domain